MERNCDNDCVTFESCNMAQFGGMCSMYRDRPLNETEEHLQYSLKTIKDSGDRTEFASGAVRDKQFGKGRYDLLPWVAIQEIAKHMENGASKYGDRNWEKGIDVSSFLDSGFRHLSKYMQGQKDEEHLVAAAWNLLCAIQTEIVKPELQNIPSRIEKEK